MNDVETRNSYDAAQQVGNVDAVLDSLRVSQNRVQILDVFNSSNNYQF